MPGPTRNPAVDDLAPLAGRWRIEARFPSDPPVTGAGEVSFEWIEERAFLVQRWRSDEPAAPDGIAVLGFDEAAGGLVQRYFDSRGVARLYRTSLDDGLWRVWREHPGFDQRYTGTLSADGATISGAWERRTDGATWEHDFDLTYTRAPDRLALARASYEAFAAGDRDAIEGLLAPDLRFSSPPDPDLDRAGYFERCWPHSANRNAFSFERLQEIGGDQVLVTYEAQRPDGDRFRNTEVLTFDGDRIRRIEVYFGWNLDRAG
jgi:ketosteroid isomerase-like protein